MDMEKFACGVVILVGLVCGFVALRELASWWLKSCRDDAEEQARREYVDEAADTIDEEATDLEWEDVRNRREM